jgi:class 3 adenylate cyclase
MAFVLTVASLYFYNIVKWGDEPEWGFFFRSGSAIDIIGGVIEEGRRAGLLPGDRILSINGKKFQTIQERRAFRNCSPKAKNTFVIERGGDQFEITIINTPTGFLSSFKQSGFPYLVGLGYVLIGILVFLMKPHRHDSWVFYIFATCLGLLMTFLYRGGAMKPSWLNTIHIFLYSFTPGAILHLALSVPVKRNLIVKHPLIEFLPYVASLLLFIGIRSSASEMQAVSRTWYLILLSYFVPALLVYILSCLHLWLRSSSEIARVRAKAILFGAVIATSLPILDMLFSNLFKIYLVPSFNYYLPFFIIFPLSIGYSITKHNLFDIDAVVRRTFGYILATFGIAGMYTLFIFIPTTISGRFELTISPAYPLVLIIAVIFVFNLTHHRIRKFIERVFFRLDYDYQDTVQRISQTMASLLSIDQIEKGMMEIASNVLFIDKGFVMLLNQKEQVYEKISGPPSTLKLPARDPLIQKIAEGKRTVTLYDIEEDPLFKKERPACKKTLEQLEATLMVPIIYEDDLIGMISLGEKKSGKFYRVEDVNLLKTLASQGAVAIENARSFEEIKDLNQELSGKKLQLENTLDELQAAMIKTEILERLKANLYKFVPTTVKKLLEKSPEAVSFGSKKQDLSVMFLDIEGYTTITETLGATAANDIVEKYFSVFIDAIYENNGDVMETAGDSLMVLFLSEDKTTNALEAVRSALMIREKTTLVNQEPGFSSQPLKINIGVSSDQAIVGASKFESYTGARWTYSATGMVVNLAARICAHATGGAVLVSRTTMERVKNHFLCKSIGKFEFKNISKKMELFTIDEKVTQ